MRNWPRIARAGCTRDARGIRADDVATVTEPAPGAGAGDVALALAATRGDQTKVVGAGPDREDVIQEVFLQLHRALPKFRSESRLSTFLRRIAMNVAIDHVRKRCRHPCMDGDCDTLDTAVDARQDPEQHSSARQQLQSLLHQLDGIAPDKRRALMLVAVAGFSLNDAAVQMGTNADRVKQIVVRARRELAGMVRRESGGRAGPWGAHPGPAASPRRANEPGSLLVATS
jgi:RNA polymerase sigma-70 factor (ECF subfamily)